MRKQLEFGDERANIKTQIENIEQNRTPISLLLDGIELPENTGLIMRLADAARLQTVYLYNCKNYNVNKIKRISRTAIQYLNIIEVDIDAIKKLKQKAQLTALEITNDSIDYREFKADFNQHTVIVIGAENKGVSKHILELCHNAVHLPMLGVNTSMNVACATSAFLYWIIGSCEGK